MKKKHLLPCLLFNLLMVGACSFEPSYPKDQFLIKGKLTNVPDSILVELLMSEGQMMRTVAKDTLINGEFSFRDTITSGVRELYLMSGSKGFPGTWLNIWVAPGKLIKISGADKLLKTWTIESDVPEQAEEDRFLKAVCPETIEWMKYLADEYDLFRVIDEHAGDETFARASWAKIDSIRKMENPLREIIAKKELDFMKEAPVSSIWMNKFLMHATRLQWDKECDYIPEIRALYSRMSDADKQTEVGQEITEYMNLGEEVNVGDDMVDGDLFDLDGNLRHLSEFKGRYIMLDFWSRGCGPCVQSIPEMEEVAEIYKDKLTVVSICGDSKQGWQEFVAEKKMTGNQWNELRKGRTGLAARYQALGIPHYILISPKGKVQEMWSGYGPGSLKSKLKELLK